MWKKFTTQRFGTIWRNFLQITIFVLFLSFFLSSFKLYFHSLFMFLINTSSVWIVWFWLSLYFTFTEIHEVAGLAFIDTYQGQLYKFVNQIKNNNMKFVYCMSDSWNYFFIYNFRVTKIGLDNHTFVNKWYRNLDSFDFIGRKYAIILVSVPLVGIGDRRAYRQIIFMCPNC